jgi:phosphate uptake regulator
MRRKLVKQGPATLTVSLPKDWIQRFSLVPGKEIELEEIGTRIIISAIDEKNKLKTITYDIADRPEIDSFLHELIVSMYKAGLSDIVIENLSQRQLALVKKIVSNCIGFEIISQEKTKIRITDLGKSDEDNLLKAEEQIYWKLLYMTDQILDIKSKIEEIKSTDSEVNKLAFFIQRNLATKFSTTSINFLRYEKIVVLESLGDSLRSYKTYVNSEKLDKKFIQNLAEIIELLRQNQKETIYFKEIRQKIEALRAQLVHNKNKKDASVLASILILKNIEQIYETVLALNIESLKKE